MGKCDHLDQSDPERGIAKPNRACARVHLAAEADNDPRSPDHQAQNLGR